MSSKSGLFPKKIGEDEARAIGETYLQYIEEFEHNTLLKRKTFIQADILLGDETKENPSHGSLYNPSPIIGDSITTQFVTAIKDSPKSNLIRCSNIKVGKTCSNLKSLGNELKQLQQERRTHNTIVNEEQTVTNNNDVVFGKNDFHNSTNLFLTNLPSNISENYLIEMFGRFGPLASAKILWPRHRNSTSSNHQSSTICGFVAFMSRLDAKRAFRTMKTDMAITWGKPIQLPPYPVYIPLDFKRLYGPPPSSGLPFNAQPQTVLKVSLPQTISLENCLVKVAIPFERDTLMLIHRMIEFVLREGAQFEAVILNRERHNHLYRFLWDYQSSDHVYYRWKLFSILNGDAKDCWKMSAFRMFKNGSIWQPPSVPDFRNGMPLDLLSNSSQQMILRSTIRTDQCTEIVTCIRKLNLERQCISEAMVLVLKNAHIIDDIIHMIGESISTDCSRSKPNLNPIKKLARLYLLTDVMYNCKWQNIPLVQIAKDDFFKGIFINLHQVFRNLKYVLDRDMFKSKVLTVLKSWLIQKYFNSQTFSTIQHAFLFGTNENI